MEDIEDISTSNLHLHRHLNVRIPRETVTFRAAAEGGYTGQGQGEGIAGVYINPNR